MANLIHWNPWRDLEEMSLRFNDFFTPNTPARRAVGTTRELGVWPQVDIEENEEGYRILADLPGVRVEDVTLKVEDGLLKLSGERSKHERTEGETFHRIERSYGSFTRTFTLPKGVEVSKIAAKSKDGVLTIFVPKKTVEEPTGFEVKIATD